MYCLRSSSVRFRFGRVTLASATSDMPSGVVMMMSGWKAIESASPYSTSFSEARPVVRPVIAVSWRPAAGAQAAWPRAAYRRLPIAFVEPLFEEVKRRRFAGAELHLDPSERPDLVPAGFLRCKLSRLRYRFSKLKPDISGAQEQERLFPRLEGAAFDGSTFARNSFLSLRISQGCRSRACPGPSAAFFCRATVSS
jgi:hypothetical protein